MRLRVVTEDNDLIVITDRGVVIRVPPQISQLNEVTQGVKVIRLCSDHKIATTAIVDHVEAQEEEIEEIEFEQKQMDLIIKRKIVK